VLSVTQSFVSLTECYNHVDHRCAQAHCLLPIICTSGSGLWRNEAVAFISCVVSWLPVSSLHARRIYIVQNFIWYFKRLTNRELCERTNCARSP